MSRGILPPTARPQGSARALGLAAFLLFVPPAAAQGLDMGAGDGGRGPIEVVADDGIEWLQNDQRLVAHGNATATRGDMTVRADRLIATYADTPTGGSEITRLEAEGAVRLTSPTQTATGTHGVHDLTTGVLELYGDPARLVTGRETLTANNRLTYDTVQGIATAEGGATVEQEDRIMRAPTLVARLTPDPADGSRLTLSTIDAVGGVTITTPAETAQGSQGNYDAKSGIATLSGSVTIVRGDNVLTGSRATVNMRTGISTLLGGAAGGGDGRARAILNPDGPAPVVGNEPAADTE